MSNMSVSSLSSGLATMPVNLAERFSVDDPQLGDRIDALSKLFFKGISGTAESSRIK
jgi:hypothetical protein